MLSPANAAAAASLNALKEELAQTYLRVHLYEQRRENFEQEHPLPIAWGGTGDIQAEKDPSMLTSQEKLELLRKQLSQTQSALRDTQRHVSALRVANGRSTDKISTADAARISSTENSDVEEDDAHEGWL